MRSIGRTTAPARDTSGIPLFGRIAGIVDTYDALTTKRPYVKRHLSPPEEIALLYSYKNTTFQKELIEQFIQTVGLYPSGSLVELSSGEVAVIIEINALRRLRPNIMVLLDENKKPYSEFKAIDLSETYEEIDIKRGLPANSFGIKMDEIFL